ncbi:N-acetyltransferase family protein, partial [Pseudokineococcus marinus]|uniref:GNAT family N-acetyltransferase n=1 Tax=Pseudokineococcus marinus TaxID=351215 RepID=UPI003CD063CB
PTSPPRARTRPSRALPRRTAPPPVPVAEGLAVAGRPWHLTTTGPGLSRAALDDDAPLDVLAGLEARGAAGAAPARLVVRAAQPADLPAVAAMHGRCTGTTLLQRYRSGGRTPSLTALADLLREPLALVVLAGPRQVVAVATARVGERPSADFTTEVGLLVEDGWQARGVGRALARHVGASLRLLGYGQVVTRSATSSLPLARVMEGVGTTRHLGAPDGGAQLTTRLDVDALDGLAGGVAAAPAGVLAAR